MVMVSKLSNFPDELSENDELREFKLRGPDCMRRQTPEENIHTKVGRVLILLESNWIDFPGLSNNISQALVLALTESFRFTERWHGLIVKCNRLPVVFHVPASTLVQTYSTSIQYLMHIPSMNTHILLCLDNSIIVNHIHDIFLLIMVWIFH